MYDEYLSQKVDNFEDIPAQSMDELYIRASTVESVELLVEKIVELSSIAKSQNLNALKLDWYLWQVGEKMDWEDELKPHHCTRTIFY